MDKQTFPGALPDTRTEELKAKDYHKDTATLSGVVEWIDKTFEEVYQFPVRNQDGSGSCVMQTCDLMMGIENYLEEDKFIEFSADLYNFRSNSGAGMIGIEALELLRKEGLTLEVMIPSMNLGESEMARLVRKESDKEVAKIFTIKNYYQTQFNVGAIASVMEMDTKGKVKKPVMVWFQFPRAEWDNNPQVTNSNYDLVRHSVTARDYGIMNGKKGIFIQDSWGLHSTTKDGLRFISEDYIKDRMIFCAYVNDKPNNWQSNKQTSYNFTRVLKKGMKGEDVMELQKLLGINNDGDFGPKTEQSVKDFQGNNGLLKDGIVGPKTLSVLIKKNYE